MIDVEMAIRMYAQRAGNGVYFLVFFAACRELFTANSSKQVVKSICEASSETMTQSAGDGKAARGAVQGGAALDQVRGR